MKSLKIILLAIITLTFTQRSNAQNLLWERIYDNPQEEFFVSTTYNFIKSNDNSLYILYSFKSINSQLSIPAVMKLTLDGNILWAFYKKCDVDVIPKLYIENEGVTIYGYRIKNSVSISLQKFSFDSSNSLISEGYDSVNMSLPQRNWGALFITKDSILLNISYRDNNIMIKEYDRNVKFIKTIILDTTFLSLHPYFAHQDRDSNIYIFGICLFKADQKNFIVKLTKDYKTIWTVVDTVEKDISNLNAVDFYDDGSFTLGGKIYPTYYKTDSTKHRLYMKHYSSDGVQLINKQFFENKKKYLFDIKRMQDSSFVFVGDTGIQGMASNFYAVKTDKYGEKIWEKTWGDTSDYNILNQCLFSENGLIYVLGRSNDRIYLACLNDFPEGTGLEDTGKAAIKPVYPNPASDMINIDIENKKENRVVICLYDIDGRFAGTLFDEAMAPGIYSISLSLPQMPPGCYNIAVNQDGQTTVRSIIIH